MMFKYASRLLGEYRITFLADKFEIVGLELPFKWMIRVFPIGSNEAIHKFNLKILTSNSVDFLPIGGLEWN